MMNFRRFRWWLLPLAVVMGGLLHFSLIGLGTVVQEHASSWRDGRVVYSIEDIEGESLFTGSYCRELAKGWAVIVKQGQRGKWRCLVESDYRRESTGRRIVKRLKRLRWPEPARVMLGISKNENSVKIPRIMLVKKTLKMEATAYDSGPVDQTRGWVGTTSIGEKARFGIAAVDPKMIAYREMLFVEGYGPALAADTGGDIRDKRIDLCFNSTREALRYGRRRNVGVHLLQWPSAELRREVSAWLDRGLNSGNFAQVVKSAGLCGIKKGLIQEKSWQKIIRRI